MNKYIIYEYMNGENGKYSYLKSNLKEIMEVEKDFKLVVFTYESKGVKVANPVYKKNEILMEELQENLRILTKISFCKFVNEIIVKDIVITDKVIIDQLQRRCNLTKPMDSDRQFWFNLDTEIKNENMKKNLKRYFALLDIDSEVKLDFEDEDREFTDNRSNNEKCRDKILYSKSFRRLGDKAQIFTSSKGDHYRNRLSHSLEVANITKSVIKELNLITNVNTGEKYELCQYLGEAMALAHDIGHTPFGHVGEREITSFLEKQFEFNNDPIKFIYFKHNMQSVRILESIEECYADEKGLKLDKSVLLGVLFHTKLPYFDNVELLCEYLNTYYFTGKHKVNSDDFRYEICNCKSIIGYSESYGELESLIVSLADEIAQKSHDIDDAIASEIICIDDLINYLDNYALNSKNTELMELVILLKNIKEIDEFDIYDRENIYRSRISSKIVNILIKCLVKDISESEDKNDVGFRKYGKKIIDLLDEVINTRVIKSREVTKFDNKGAYVVRSLLHVYTENLTYLPLSYRKRITEELFKLEPSHAFDLSVIDIQLSNELNNILSINDEIIKEKKNNLIVTESDIRYKQRKIIIQIVVDYVAGMSDNYALERYEELCVAK